MINIKDLDKKFWTKTLNETQLYVERTTMNRESVYEQLKIDEGVVISDMRHLVSGIWLRKVTRSTEVRSELPSQKKELESASNQTSTRRSQSVTLYTEKGHLQTTQLQSRKSWST